MNRITDSTTGPGGPDGIQSAALRRVELARDIFAAGLDRGDFILADGRATNYYFHRYSIFTKPTILRRVADLVANLLPGTVDRIAGATDGSLILAEAVSLHTGLPFVAVSHARPGSPDGIQGEIYQGEEVVAIEDIISTGHHALDIAHKIQSVGASVTRVLAAIDRRDGATALLEESGFILESLFTVDDIIP